MTQPTVFERNPTLALPSGRQAWQASFQPVLADLRTQLLCRQPQQIAAQAGAAWDQSRCEICLQWLDQPYRITWPDLVASVDGVCTPAAPSHQGLLLSYLARADGTPLAGKWIGFRELPDGWLYHQAFQAYTGNRLTQEFGNDLLRFAGSATEVARSEIDIGDRGYAFHVLPMIWLAVVYWQGDVEFPPQAQVLFDASAGRYLPADGLAMLGRQVTAQLLPATGGEETHSKDNRR